MLDRRLGRRGLVPTEERRRVAEPGRGGIALPRQMRGAGLFQPGDERRSADGSAELCGPETQQPADRIGARAAEKETTMWQVTDAVIDAMAQMRDENNAQSDEGILLYFSPEGNLGLALAKPGGEDQVFARDGSPIVIIAADTVQTYEGVTLDLEEDENGIRLHLFQDEEGDESDAVEGDAD